jgi:hypothetical protein
MGASDYMVGNAPGGVSFAAPLVGQQIGQAIGNLPADYMQGRQFARQRAIQDAFPEGIPMRKDAPGVVDTPEIMNRMARAGGGEYIQGLMQYLLNAETDRAAAQHVHDINSHLYPQTTSGPANLQQRPQSSAPATSPQGSQYNPPLASSQGPSPTGPMSPAGMDSNGGETIRTMLSGLGGAKKNMKTAIDTVAATLGLDADTALTPSQSARVGNYVRSNAVELGIRPPSNTPQTTENSQNAIGQEPTAQPTPNNQVQTQVPANTQGPPFARQKTAQAQEVSPQQSTNDEIENDPGVLNRRRWAGVARELAAATARNNPQGSLTQIKAAEALEEQAKQRVEYLSKLAAQKQESELRNKELTPEEKLTRANNVATPLENTIATKVAEGQVKAGQSAYLGGQAKARQFSETLKPALVTTKALLNSPKMRSGFGGNQLIELSRLREVLGDKDAAVLQEAMGKITAQSVLSMSNEQRDEMQETGATSMRIFSQQVDLANQAAPQMSNTLAGNRFLVNYALKLGEFAEKKAQMQRDYLQTHKFLDAGYDQELADELHKHPIFNAQELAHPEALGAPDVPTNIKTMPQLKAWEKSMGLKQGDYFRSPDGVMQIK